MVRVNLTVFLNFLDLLFPYNSMSCDSHHYYYHSRYQNCQDSIRPYYNCR